MPAGARRSPIAGDVPIGHRRYHQVAARIPNSRKPPRRWATAAYPGLPQIRVQDLLHQVEREHGLVRERCRADMPRWAQALHVDWYDFEHRALQGIVRKQQAEGARLLRHARIAEALQRVPRADDALPHEVRVVIADHLRQAGPACAAGSAAAHFELARSVAVDDLSFRQAETYCRIAIDSARQLPEGHPERDRRLAEAVELLLCLTQVRWKGDENAQETPGIDALAAEAEAAAHRLGDRPLIARTTLLRGRTLLAVRGLRPALAKLEEAVAHARACGSDGVWTLFVALAEYGGQLPKHDLQAGLRVLFEAEELYASAPQLGDTRNPVLQHARNLNEMQIGVNLFDAGRFGEALSRLLRCAERLRGEALRAELPIALNYLAQLHIAMGAEEEAEAALREALSFEEQPGGQEPSDTEPSGWHANNNALLALIASRDPARAHEALTRARAAWAETQRTWMVDLVPIVRNLYVEVLLTLDEEQDLARRLIEDTLVETEHTGMARSRVAAYCLRSRVRLADGDARGAAEDVREALAILEERGAMPALRTEEVMYDASRALAAVGADAEAAELLERARAEVLRKADSIPDPRPRERFLTAVPLNRALFENVRPDPAAEARDQGVPGAGE